MELQEAWRWSIVNFDHSLNASFFDMIGVRGYGFQKFSLKSSEYSFLVGVVFATRQDLWFLDSSVDGSCAVYRTGCVRSAAPVGALDCTGAVSCTGAVRCTGWGFK